MHPHSRLVSSIFYVNPRQVFVAILTICLITDEIVCYIPQNKGAMKMCPPGGESFAMAWQLTCGMRKKRSLPLVTKDNSVNTRVIHWLAYYHHKFGIRHLILLTVIVLYTVFGGLMFNALENANEKNEIEIIKRIMQETLSNLSLEVIRISESTDIEEQMKFQNVFILIEKSYKTLLTVEGKYIGDTYRKSDDNSLQEIWDFQSAVFYSMTLYAAIGFGGISCATTWGKIASIIYTAFGIPLTIVVLADIANLLLNSFTRIYNYFLNVYMRKKMKQQNLPYVKEATKELPLKLCILILVIYLIFCSLIIAILDYEEGGKSLGFGDSFYFCFISLSTVGIGDVMPYNFQFSPIMALMFLFGLSIIAMVTTRAYETMRPRYVGMMNSMEKQLKHIHESQYPKGHMIFREMTPAFKLATIAFPDMPKKGMYEFDQKGRRSLGIQVDFQENSETLPQDIGVYLRSYSSRRTLRVNKQPKIFIT